MHGRAPFDAIPAAISGAGEMGLFLLISPLRRIIGGQRVQVQEAGLARIALFRDDHPDAKRLRLVREHLQKLRVRNLQ